MASFGIDEFKSEINKRGGLAPQNRFNVFFTPPSQALINIDIGQILSSITRGSFNKNQLISDPRSISLLVESTSFPSRQLEALKFTNTGKFDEKRVIKAEDASVEFTFYAQELETDELYSSEPSTISINILPLNLIIHLF